MAALKVERKAKSAGGETRWQWWREQCREKVMVVLGRNRETFLLVKGSRGKNSAHDCTQASGFRNSRSWGPLLQNGEFH